MNTTEDRIFELIDRLAIKLGTTADMIWAVLKSQAHVHFFYYCIQTVILIIVGWVVIKYTKMRIKEEDNEKIRFDDWDIGKDMLLFLGWLFFVGFFIAWSCGMNSAITALLNPDYWAIKQIFKSLTCH